MYVLYNPRKMLFYNSNTCYLLESWKKATVYSSKKRANKIAKQEKCIILTLESAKEIKVGKQNPKADRKRRVFKVYINKY